MDILFHLIVWIIKAVTQSGKSASPVERSKATLISTGATRQVQPTLSASEQKTRDIWQAYRKKQEALEAQFRAKAPK